MRQSVKNTLLFLRITLGWLFIYAGYTKIVDPEWSAAGYLENANTFPELFSWMAQPDILPIVNTLNEWGLLLIGIALVIGLFTRAAAYLGIMVMILYYLPALSFPYVDHGFLVDSHIIYIAALLVLASTHSGTYFGLDGMRR